MLNARLNAFSSLLKFWSHCGSTRISSYIWAGSQKNSFLSIVQIQMKQFFWWTAVQYITWVSFSVI